MKTNKIKFRRVDPYSGNTFFTTRRNQKFETSLNQIAFQRLKATRKRAEKLLIDKILDRNREVVINLLGTRSEMIVRRAHLISLGYRFGFGTHYVFRNSEFIQCIYEFEVVNLINDSFRISRATI